MKEMRRIKAFVRLPKITKDWLRGWRREFGASLRKPTRRYKVNKATLLERLKVMWSNTLKFRLLAKYSLGHDLIAWGVDQKPLHMNEGGSKQIRTLHFVGPGHVDLKENVVATRSRVSLMTMVRSPSAETRGTWPSLGAPGGT